MSHNNCDSSSAVSPTICPNVRGRIGEGKEDRDTNFGSNSRPKGLDSEQNEDQTENKEEENKEEEAEIEIPESGRIPNTLGVEEHLKHQIMHYTFKEWCPICVKTQRQTNPTKR